MRELKAEAGPLCQNGRLRGRKRLRKALLAARDRLDSRRPRASRGWRTAVEHDRALPAAAELVDRDLFYGQGSSVEIEHSSHAPLLTLVDPQRFRVVAILPLHVSSSISPTGIAS